MIITYFGHSCFKIEQNGFEIVIDPFKDVKGYKDVKTTADMVLCSHDHFDHNAVSGVKFVPSGKENPFQIQMMQTYHDDVKGEKRGKNLVHIISAEGKKIVHLGDLGHIINSKQIEYVKNCDCLLIPVGGNYTISSDEAWQIISDINPKIVVPMHYRNGKYGFDEISSLAEFVKNSNRKTEMLLGNKFELTDKENVLIVPAIEE